MMNRRNDLRKRDSTSPELPTFNKDIQNRICVHKRQKWRDFVEIMDQKTDLTKLWRTIKGIDGRAKREARDRERSNYLQWNLVLIVQGASHQVQPTVQYFKAGQTYLFKRDPNSDEGKRKPLEMARTFTADLVMKAIKSCRNSKVFGADKLSIFHLKHLGPRAIEYIHSVTTYQIPTIWKSSLIIPIPKPGKNTSQETSYRPISLLCPAAKVLDSLLLSTYHSCV